MRSLNQGDQGASQCPDMFALHRFHTGTLTQGELKSVSEHVEGCRYCAVALHELVAEEQGPDSDTQAAIGQFPSSSPEEQRRMALRLPAGRSTWLIWAGVAAAIGVSVALAAAWHYGRADGTISQELIAQTYGSQRPFAYKFAAASYGPVANKRSLSTELPAALSPSLARCQHDLNSTTGDVSQLADSGRVAALASELALAANCLQKAHDLAAIDGAIANDYAAVLAAKGQAEDSQPLLEQALALFDEALRRRPDDWTAGFNRGLVLMRLGRHQEVAEQWRQCLRLNPPSAWRAEIETRLRDLK